MMISILVSLAMQIMVFDFSGESQDSNWRIVDDVVMGGRSAGQFEINEAGNGHFFGEVSLENNGGFSSVRSGNLDLKIDGQTEVVIRLKGDGKRYQFRLKDDPYKRYSYIQYFETSGEWQEVRLPLQDFYPSFRGQKLKMPNFEGPKIAEVTFLIANYKAEEFDLEIDWIALQ